MSKHNFFTRASAAQCDHIALLSIDLGFSAKRRSAHISSILERPIHFLDEMTLDEASTIITTFKGWKENANRIPNLPPSETDEESGDE